MKVWLRTKGSPPDPTPSTPSKPPKGKENPQALVRKPRSVRPCSRSLEYCVGAATISLIVVIPGFNSVWRSIIKEKGARPRSRSQRTTTSSGTRAGEIIHMISVGGWGRGGRNEPVRLVCQASLTRERLGGGDQTTRWDPEPPGVQGGGKTAGVWGTRVEAWGGQPGAGRQPPGQCAPPAPRGKYPREAAARALALPARRPPRGTRRRRRRLLPARGPGQPAARSRRSLPSRPPAASRTQRGTRGRGGRPRSRWNRKPAERRQEADPAAS